MLIPGVLPILVATVRLQVYMLMSIYQLLFLSKSFFTEHAILRVPFVFFIIFYKLKLTLTYLRKTLINQG